MGELEGVEWWRRCLTKSCRCGWMRLRLCEGLEGALVEVGDCDASGQGCIVWMSGGESSSCLCGEFVELRGGDALVDSSSNLLSDENLCR